MDKKPLEKNGLLYRCDAPHYYLTYEFNNCYHHSSGVFGCSKKCVSCSHSKRIPGENQLYCTYRTYEKDPTNK